MMLSLLKAAAQFPPIYVTVQQPASRSVRMGQNNGQRRSGAAFDIGANVLMEYVKR